MLLSWDIAGQNQHAATIINNYVQGDNIVFNQYFNKNESRFINTVVTGNVVINKYYGVPQNYVNRLLQEIGKGERDREKLTRSYRNGEIDFEKKIAEQVKRYKEMKQSFDSVRTRLPSDLYAKMEEAYNQGDIDKVIVLADEKRMLYEEKQLSYIRLMKAKALFLIMRMEEGEQNLIQSIKINENRQNVTEYFIFLALSHRRSEELIYLKKLEVLELHEGLPVTVYGDMGSAYAELNELDSAFYYINKSVEQSIELKDSGRAVLSDYNNLARISFRIGQSEQAAIYFKKLADIYASLKDKSAAELLAEAINGVNWGDYQHHILNNDTAAMHLYRKSLDIFDSLLYVNIEDAYYLRFYRCTALCGIATAQKNAGNYKLALITFKECIRVLDSLGVIGAELKIKTLVNLGNCYVVMDSVELALSVYNEAVELSNNQYDEGYELDDTRFRLYIQAAKLVRLFDYPRGEEYYQKIQAILTSGYNATYSNGKNNIGRIMYYTRLGELYQNMASYYLMTCSAISPVCDRWVEFKQEVNKNSNDNIAFTQRGKLSLVRNLDSIKQYSENYKDIFQEAYVKGNTFTRQTLDIIDTLEKYQRTDKIVHSFAAELTFLIDYLSPGNQSSLFLLIGMSSKKTADSLALINDSAAVAIEYYEEALGVYTDVLMRSASTEALFYILEIYSSIVKLSAPPEKVKYQKKKVDLLKTIHAVVSNGETVNVLSENYGNLAWYQLLNRQFTDAEINAVEGLRLNNKNEWINTNLALSLVLQGKLPAAMKIYEKLCMKNYEGNKLYRDVFIEDINEMEANGIKTADFHKVRAYFKKK